MDDVLAKYKVFATQARDLVCSLGTTAPGTNRKLPSGSFLDTICALGRNCLSLWSRPSILIVACAPLKWGAFGSIPADVKTHSVRLCPRQELNLHLLLRTELFYPLNYEGIVVRKAAVAAFLTTYFMFLNYKPRRLESFALSKPTVISSPTKITGTPICPLLSIISLRFSRSVPTL